MFRHALILVVANLIVCGVASADGTAKLAVIAAEDGRPSPLMDRFLMDGDDTLEDVSKRTVDVIYGRKHGMALTMDVYRPLRDRNGRGIILVVSGGFWSGPEYRRMPMLTSKVRTLVEHGFTVFAVMHGSQPRYSIVDIIRDVQRAVRYVRHRHREFDIDSRQIGILGDSSGGHLALLAATLPTKQIQDPADAADVESSGVQAVVAYYPNTDLTNYGKNGRLINEHFRSQGLAMGAVFNFRKWDTEVGDYKPITAHEKLTVLRDLSPISHVSTDDPPTLLLHGKKDELVPIQQSHDFARRLKNVGVECDLFVAKEKEHGWEEPVDGETDKLIGWLRRHLHTGTN